MLVKIIFMKNKSVFLLQILQFNFFFFVKKYYQLYYKML